MLETQQYPTSDEGILDGSAVSLATEPVRCFSTSQSANVGWELLLLSCVQYAPLANMGTHKGIKGIFGVFYFLVSWRPYSIRSSATLRLPFDVVHVYDIGVSI